MILYDQVQKDLFYRLNESYYLDLIRCKDYKIRIGVFKRRFLLRDELICILDIDTSELDKKYIRGFK